MKRVLLLSTALISGLMVTPVFAASEEEMMAQLKAMQAQMARMQKDMNAMQAELAKTKAQAAASQKTADNVKAKMQPKTPESDVKFTLSPGPKLETADGNYSFRVGGFAQFDGGIFDDDVRDRPDGTNIRRARLNASGTIARDFKYKLENDFASTTTNGSITDAYIEYTGLEPVTFMIGQFKEPFGLETLTSDLFTTFNERASPVAFSPDRKIGVQVASYGTLEPVGAWTATLGGFGGNASTVSSTNDEARDITGRITLAPWSGKTEVLHFGLAGSYRIPDGGDTFSFSSRSETQMSTSSTELMVNSGTISDVKSVNLLGLEAAGVYGPFSLQGEYVLADVDREVGRASPTYNGYYVEASYFLTGESRNYSAKQAKFDRVTPKWQFSPKENQWGAWQVAARYSDLDLNDGTFHGGEMKNTTLGLRWIPQANMALTANYIMVNTDGFAPTANDDPNIWLLRAQYDF